MEFKIGDRVEGEYGLGRVIGFSDEDIGVEHDKYMNGHDCSGCIKQGKPGKDGYCHWYFKSGLKKVGDNMKKKDLKANDIVTLRNGDRLVYTVNGFKDLNRDINNTISGLSQLNNDLTRSSGAKQQDIIKVERPVEYETVFEREEVQELTVDEISERLGYKVKVVGEDR